VYLQDNAHEYFPTILSTERMFYQPIVTTLDCNLRHNMWQVACDIMKMKKVTLIILKRIERNYAE